MAKDNLGAYNIFDLRDMALKRTPKMLFEFVDRGSEDEVALRNNRAAFERIKLNPRTLVDVSGRSQEITLFGNKQAMPIAIAPTGAAGLLWPEGELALARAAKEAGIPFTFNGYRAAGPQICACVSQASGGNTMCGSCGLGSGAAHNGGSISSVDSSTAWWMFVYVGSPLDLGRYWI